MKPRLQIAGTGLALPATEVGNDELFHALGIDKPSAWLAERFGIRTRRLDLDLATMQPVEGLSDTALAERACRQALDDADADPREVDLLVHVTCTPDEIHFLASVIALKERLGLRSDAMVDHVDSGCAGLAKAFVDACAFVESGRARTVLLVASNFPSAFIRANVAMYVAQKIWLSPVVFGDGAGAVLLRAREDTDHGLLDVFYEVDGRHPLVRYAAGGAAWPTTADNLGLHAYAMDARDVAEQFAPAMLANLERLGLAQIGARDRVARWYLHQANRFFVEGFAREVGIPVEKAPINIDRYGNTSAASTLILLDEDRRAGRVQPGDRLAFLWVGAGMMRGGAVIEL